jgi:hypothetical protein
LHLKKFSVVQAFILQIELSACDEVENGKVVKKEADVRCVLSIGYASLKSVLSSNVRELTLVDLTQALKRQENALTVRRHSGKVWVLPYLIRVR